MKELITMTAEELRDHIKECEAILKNKENERFEFLLSELASAAQALFTEYPNTELVVETYCEGCEREVEVAISIDKLAYESHYVK